jgi:hypothetical protein
VPQKEFFSICVICVICGRLSVAEKFLSHRHHSAFLGASSAHFGALGTLFHIRFVAFGGAGVAYVGAKRAQLHRETRLPADESRRLPARLRAVDAHSGAAGDFA